MFAGLWPGPVLLNGLNADKALYGGAWEGSSCSGLLLAASAGGVQDAKGAGEDWPQHMSMSQPDATGP